MLISGRHNFADNTTAMVSWHVPKCAVQSNSNECIYNEMKKQTKMISSLKIVSTPGNLVLWCLPASLHIFVFTLSDMHSSFRIRAPFIYVETKRPSQWQFSRHWLHSCESWTRATNAGKVVTPTNFPFSVENFRLFILVEGPRVVNKCILVMLTQRTHYVFNNAILMSKRRRFDVIMTLLLRRVSTGDGLCNNVMESRRRMNTGIMDIHNWIMDL